MIPVTVPIMNMDVNKNIAELWEAFSNKVEIVTTTLKSTSAIKNPLLAFML